MKRINLLLTLCLIVLVVMACKPQSIHAATRTAHPIALIKTRLTPAERLTIFNAVWQTINDKYFDPTFGGKDWQAIGTEYRQKLASVQDDDTSWRQVLNPMLFELGVSHVIALPPDLANEFDRMTFATGSLGMDIRLLVGMAVVTQVAVGSAADQAGLRTGFMITSVDGWALEDLSAQGLHTPPYNEVHQRGIAVQSMRGRLYGETGTEVIVEYLDENDQPQLATLRFTSRNDSTCASFDPSLPSGCAEIEVRRLANNIGYLRFSGFLNVVLDRVLQAINNFHDTPALIIDLRGNPGGLFFVRKAIASQLVGTPELFIRYQYRVSLEEAYLDPAAEAYQGIVVILVDEYSISSSEEFAGSLQALGRATIIGSQTPGSCLVMNIESLPYGTILGYPFGQLQTSDGRVLENNGVVPDIEVALDRQQILQGRDTQLEAALNYLEH
jgi:carboxyl-terminal processing protease